jgi:hypothetical protein
MTLKHSLPVEPEIHPRPLLAVVVGVLVLLLGEAPGGIHDRGIPESISKSRPSDPLGASTGDVGDRLGSALIFYSVHIKIHRLPVAVRSAPSFYSASFKRATFFDIR